MAKGVGRGIKGLISVYKSHIWIEVVVSIALVCVVLLVSFYHYMQSQYYQYLIQETEKADRAVLSATANSLDSILSKELQTGSEIAVNQNLYSVVRDAINSDSVSLAGRRLIISKLADIIYYSEDMAAIAVITEKGLLCEYGRYWNSSMPLWTGDNLSALPGMYAGVMDNIGRRKAGYYYVSSEPRWRNDIPKMNVYHIAFPLIGQYSTLSRVKAVVVITYNMKSIAGSGALVGGDSDYTHRYLTDSDGVIFFHNDEKYIGQKEADYLTDSDTYSLSRELGYFSWRVNAAIDRNLIRQNAQRVYKNGFIVYGALFILAFLALQARMRSILKPIDIIRRAMRDTERGGRKKIEIKGEHEVWLLAREYNAMIDALTEQQLKTQKEYQEKMVLSELRTEAERTALESQINAHFIFNTLNAINYHVMEAGNLESARMIKYLSSILRYSLQPKTEATLGTEFEMAKQYLYLQKYRLMDKFEYELSFPEEYGEWPCCKLFLQPFIENSILHGFENMESGGLITVYGRAEGERFLVEITDNGRGMTPEARDGIQRIMGAAKALSIGKSGMGIRNVIIRMKMFFGDSFEARLYSEVGQGAKFIFLLPLPQASDEPFFKEERV